MIRVISVDSERVQLLPDAVAEDPRLNVFAADSMTLIVGPNGSGKTRLLRSAVNSILEGDSFSVQTESELSKVEVIYLTLSSFSKPVFAKKSNRLHVIYRARASDGLAIDAATRGLLLKLGARPKYFLRLKGGVQDGAKILFAGLQKAYEEGALIDDELLRLMREMADFGISAADQGRSRASRAIKEVANLRELEWLRNQVIGLIGIRLSRILRSRLRPQRWEDELPAIWLRSLSLYERGDERGTIVAALLTALQLSKDPRGLRGRSSYASMDKLLSYLQGLIRFRNDYSVEDMSKDLHRVDQPGHPGADAGGHFSDICEPEIREASSGMSALVMQFVEIRGALKKIRATGRREVSLVLMIDEGDVFLHLEWQQKYISLLNEFIDEIRSDFVGVIYSVQVILTSHSPVLMSDFPRDCIHRLYEPGTKVDAKPIVSFGAQLPDIVRSTGGAGTVGDFAFQTISKWARVGRSGGSVSPYHGALIDDPILREIFDREMDIFQE